MSEPLSPGAPPAEGMVPLFVPEIRGNEWTYIKECLDTNWVSSVGPFVDRFEREIAQAVGIRHAVAIVNGTSALHLALLISGVERDDEVIVSALTFIAPANAIRYTGAWPVFMDAEPRYWQMDPGKLEEFLTRGCEWTDGVLRNRATGRRVKAIVPVGILGHPCDMDAILTIARRFELQVIGDATECLGATYKGRSMAAGCDSACYSFNGNKIITTGGGGMIMTDSETIAARARYLSTQAKDDPIEYVHGEVGFNYRLTNIQAAMGVAQLEQLPSYVEAKRNIAERYREAVASVPGLTAMPESPDVCSTFWLYTVLVDEARFGIDSRALLRSLSDAQIQARPLWQPLHRSKPFHGCPAYRVEVADLLARDALSLPSSVSLDTAQQERVVETLRAAATVPR
ncbi:MAG: LegC family aminotransferase [Vicinamibacterales bacterium]